jgi:hypothetical protein
VSTGDITIRINADMHSFGDAMFSMRSEMAKSAFLIELNDRCARIRGEVAREIERKFTAAFGLPVDRSLWQFAQRFVYPTRTPSEHPPFPPEMCSPTVKRASWLYHQLANTRLRAEVRS